jgi:hypothetical protein
MTMSTSRSNTISPLQLCVPSGGILRRLVVRVGRIVFVFLGMSVRVGIVPIVISVSVSVLVLVVIDSLSGHSGSSCEIVVRDTGDVLVVELGYEFVPLHGCG